MPLAIWIALATSIFYIIIHKYIIERLYKSPLARIPGPNPFAFTKWRLALEEWNGRRTVKIGHLHEKYGPVVRIGPSEVSFNSLSALKSIYGAGSGFERTTFYDMFDVYGRKNLFTFHSVKEHADRKKLLAHAYSKSVMLKGETAEVVQKKVKNYMTFIQKAKNGTDEIFTSLHYFAIDAISDFLYGTWGATNCLGGDPSHQSMLHDILDTSRRRLSWFAVHFPSFTKWIYSRTGLIERLVHPLYPMQKPTTYTGIREHALHAYTTFSSSSPTLQNKHALDNAHPTILDRLYQNHSSIKPQGGLDDLDIASELADHLLAGIDTTSDTAMFLIWALSRPCNIPFQEQLISEVLSLSASSLDDAGIPTVSAADKLPFLDAVIKETLRLYAPLPATEPRRLGRECVVDGYVIPAHTVVGMSPFSLHRNGDVFRDPLVFNPRRWIDSSVEEMGEMKKWFWAFGSGGRMCIGVHLAMAELTTLTAAIYRKYRTRLDKTMENCGPGITSRFEVFHDALIPEVKEHKCWIVFEEHGLESADEKLETS